MYPYVLPDGAPGESPSQAEKGPKARDDLTERLQRAHTVEEPRAETDREASSGPVGGSGLGVRPHPAGLTQQSGSQLHCRVKETWATSPATRAQWDQVTSAYRKRGKGRARPEHVPRHILLAFLRSTAAGARALGEEQEQREEDEEEEEEEEESVQRQQEASRAAHEEQGPSAAGPGSPELSSENTNPDEKVLHVHAHLLQQPEYGDWMSVIGSRFRIRLAEVRSCFVVSDVTSHDAWISTLPHSNVYFQRVEDSFTEQMLHAECGTFGRVIMSRILTKPGRTYKCAVVKFGSI